MEEVTNIEDANYSVVLSESFGKKRIIQKIYFDCEDSDPFAAMIKWVAEFYAPYIDEGTRIDIYRCANGRTFARI